MDDISDVGSKNDKSTLVNVLSLVDITGREVELKSFISVEAEKGDLFIGIVMQ